MSLSYCVRLFVCVFFPQFMNEVRDCESYLRQLQDTIKRQYTCDRNSRLGKLEDLLQDSMVRPAVSVLLLRSRAVQGSTENFWGKTILMLCTSRLTPLPSDLWYPLLCKASLWSFH